MDASLPVTRDTIFRIASLTTPVTTVAALTLLDPDKADPTDGAVLVFLSHTMADLPQMAQGIGLGVWSAIGTFHQGARA